MSNPTLSKSNPILSNPTRSLLFSCLLAVGMVIATVSNNAADETSDGAAWLTAQQLSGGATDGAFPWTAGSGTVPINTQGATALGLLRAYEVTNDAATLNSAIAAGDFIIGGYGGIAGGMYTDGDHRFATHDMMFLEELSVISGDSTYADFTQTNFWDKLTSSTYGESNNLDAAGFGTAVVNSRAGSGNVELAAWDLSKAAIAAHMAGETTARDALMDAILDGLNMTTVTDTTFDLHGLSGAIWASAVTGIDLDPTSGTYALMDSTTDLANELLNWQTPGGGWVFNSDFDPSDSSGSSTQVTAFAMLALNDLDANLYDSEIQSGLSYLRSIQDGSGQFLSFIGASSNSTGGIEVHGEALEAFAVTIPEPTSFGVIGLMAICCVARRRKRQLN